MGMVARTLSQQLHSMIRDCNSASEMWKKITGRFEATSEASVTDAWMNLFFGHVSARGWCGGFHHPPEHLC